VECTAALFALSPVSARAMSNTERLLEKSLLWNAEDVYNWASQHELENVKENAATLQVLKLSSLRLLDPAIVDELVKAGVPRFSALDIHDCMKLTEADFNRQSLGPALVFWDIENVQLPKGRSAQSVVQQLRKKVEKYGRVSIRIYGGSVGDDGMLQKELLDSGCIAVNTPHLGKKEVADKIIIAETLLFAWENKPPASIILITADADFAYMLSRLKDRGYRTVLIAPHANLDSRKGLMLRSSVKDFLSWELDILERGGDAVAHGQAPAGAVDLPDFTGPNASSQSTAGGSEIFADILSAIAGIESEPGGRPLRSRAASKVLSSNAEIYKRAAFHDKGLTTFKKYAEAAQAAGLVQLGTEGAGREWIQRIITSTR